MYIKLRHGTLEAVAEHVLDGVPFVHAPCRNHQHLSLIHIFLRCDQIDHILHACINAYRAVVYPQLNLTDGQLFEGCLLYTSCECIRLPA